MSFLAERRTILAGLGLLAALSLGAYLISSAVVLRIGFPLDDAWIHQTYARNLGTGGAWEFLPGQPSAGSTAPLWTFLLSAGYWSGLNNYLWTFLIGWLLLWALGVSIALGFKRLAPGYAGEAIFVGALVILEWHLTWAAGSGMETILAALIALLVILGVMYLTGRHPVPDRGSNWSWFGIGVLLGIGVWVRPDVITLLIAVGPALLLQDGDTRRKLNAALSLAAGLLLVGLPYLYFNLLLAGEIWPNTFYAKQAEYAVLREFPIWQRIWNVARQPLTGVGLLLLPGFIWFGVNRVRNRTWAELFSAAWVFGYLLMYALQLPVSYQHGRYVMPVIPVFCLLGMVGSSELIGMLSIVSWKRLAATAWIASSTCVVIAFWFLGMRAYAADVAVIESEMVATARWLEAQTDENALIAAHDIGALGFYSRRNLIDLAGLVSPQVIGFIRDESALAEYIGAQQADYLVTFPGWYPELVEHGERIHQTTGQFSPAQGGENMTVYRWIGP